MGKEYPEISEYEDQELRAQAEAGRREDKAREFVEALESFVNDFNCPVKEALQALARSHPTLQQGTVRFFIRMAEAMASPSWRWVDGRNEAAVAFCKEVIEKIPIEKRSLPLI